MECLMSPEHWVKSFNICYSSQQSRGDCYPSCFTRENETNSSGQVEPEANPEQIQGWASNPNDSQNVVPGPAATAFPRNLSDIQILWPTPDLLNNRVGVGVQQYGL